MIITNKQLLEAAKPLIKLMNELHPHHTAIVTATDVELFQSQMFSKTEEFLKD
mgnify:CR=1 FL=1